MHVVIKLNLFARLLTQTLSKVGVVKVWWEEREEESRETYYDLTDDQFALLAQAVDRHLASAAEAHHG